MKEITLYIQNDSSVVLKLNDVKKQYTAEEILSVRSSVYNDFPYKIRLDCEQNIDSVSVYINGEHADTEYESGIIRFIGDFVCPFYDIIGFAQISLHIHYTDMEEEWKYSEFVSVLIKQTKTNKTLDAMLKFVYENQQDILYRDTQVTSVGDSFDNFYDDFWSQIVLMEEIANVYENDFGYFMANCRTKLESDYVLDRVEKLQNIDSQTLQYIVQHPEYLHSSVNGIKYGLQTFLPLKTMMSQKRITNDIYENQVVISFLEHLLDEITTLTDKIKYYTRLTQIEPETEDGYVVSAYLLYVNAKDTLNEFLEKIVGIQKQYQELVNSYSRILDVRRIPMINRPEPTSIFMNLPQYNRIYTCIIRWFGKRGYDLLNERIMFSFINASSIYEAYVLIKLINQIKDNGYSLELAKLVSYPKRSSWRYINKKYNNTYIFSNGDSTITLYYEPIVYDEDKSGLNGVSLYRNNSISLNREGEEERRGSYYVPDYILKYESKGIERYIICDAKFSRIQKIRYKMMPDLIYKYITSISPLNHNSEIGGMYILYGLTEDNSDVISFYDRCIHSAKPISPCIEMIPLSEGVSYSKQRENSIEMLNVLET